MQGEALQIIAPAEGHQFQLKKDILVKLLTHPEVKDREVCIVSVAGAFRKGKSFLLGFFLRYLYKNYVARNFCNNANWLGDEEQPLEGFSWRGGSERHTTGILIWSEVFLYDHPNGKKIAILLLDTQGTFDNKTTLHNCATVFALSTMLSSVQVYNISGNLQENDLQHLQLFTEYGRLALESNQCKPFQKLQFLIRDWIFTQDAAHGADGGRKIIERFLNITYDMHSELSSLREHISTCFTNIECFLLPHPGEGIENPDFKGALKDIRDIFKKQINDFVPLLLSADNLILKKIDGKSLTATNVVFFFEKYTELFGSDKLPKPKNILEATAEANHQAAVFTLTEKYNEIMQELTDKDDFTEPPELERISCELRDKLLHEFSTQPKMGSDKLHPIYLEKLEVAIANAFECYKDVNNSKLATAEANHQTSVSSITDEYNRKMDELTHKDAPFIEPADFQRMHCELMEKLLNEFSSQPKISNDELHSSYHNKLKAHIEKAFEGYNNINNSKLVNIKGNLLITVSNLTEEYNKRMQELTHIDEPFIKPNIFQRKHCELRDNLLHEFSTQQKTGSEKSHSKYLKKLRADIETAFEGYNTINNSKLVTTEANFQKSVSNLTDQYKKKMLELTHNDAPFMQPIDFLVAHNELKDKLIHEFLTQPIVENNELYKTYLEKLKTNIEKAFKSFQELNNRKLNAIEVDLQSAVIKLTGKYISKMEEFANDAAFLTAAEFESKHNKVKEQLIDEFLKQSKMGNDELKSKYLRKLKMDIKKAFQDFKREYMRKQELAENNLLNAIYKCSRLFENQMRNTYNEEYLKPVELDAKLLKSLQGALNEFDKQPRLVGEDVFQKLRAQLEADIKLLFSDYKNQNMNKLAVLRADLEKAFTNAKQLYNIKMQYVTSRLLSPTDFERAHEEASNEVFTTFDAQKNEHMREEFETRHTQLRQDINTAYNMLKGLNQNKELHLKVLFNEANENYRDLMDQNRSKYMAREDLRKKHENSKAHILDQFKSEQNENGSPIFLTYYESLIRTCDNLFPRYEQENNDILVRAEAHYRQMKIQEKEDFEEKIDNVSLRIANDEFEEICQNAKESALNAFDADSELFGDVQIFYALREELIKDLDRIVSYKEREIDRIKWREANQRSNCTIS